MPWGCSERRRSANWLALSRALAGRPLLSSSLTTLSLTGLSLSALALAGGALGPWTSAGPAVDGLANKPGPVLAAAASPKPIDGQRQWRQGVFPVLAFSGYTSFFGSRLGPWGAVEPHYGLDIAAPLGSAIHSWWGGTVSEVIDDDRCGVGLRIRSGNYEHIYCHLLGSSTAGVYRCGALQIHPGQRVRTGQLIGRIGVSGRSTGPHLHWGLRYDGQWLNPVLILRAMAQSRRIAPAS